MFKLKSIAGILLVVTLLFSQVGIVFAAPALQETTPIIGTVTAISKEVDSNGVTTVLVTIKDDMGGTQTVRISAQSAVDLGLASYGTSTNELVLVDPTTLTEPVTIEPTAVIVDEEPAEEPFNPVAAMLATFFSVDVGTVNKYHEDGYGFGVIAQAMWISRNVNGDASIAGLILQAKESGNYGDILLSDGTVLTMPDGSAPQNWGQFKKALLDKKNNLGVIVSGKEENEDGTAELNSQQDHGNSKNKNKNKGNGHGNKQ